MSWSPSTSKRPLANSYERFDENGDLTDEETRQRLKRFIEALYEWTEGLVRAGLVEKESVR